VDIGKIPNELLDRIIINNLKNKREEVLVRAGIGKDCAVIDFGEQGCVLSTDPITGASSNIGKLAIHISCNDVAASGAEPIGVLLTMLMPPNTTEEDLEKIIKDAGEAAEELNVEIVGGHTEITDVVNKIVLITTVVGKQKKSDVLKNSDISPGDIVIMTKTAGIEGTAIIATDLEEKLKDRLPESIIEDGKNHAKEISVLKEGMIGGKMGAKYMHDITEGGVLGAVWETAKSNDLGIIIDENMIPITEATREIAKTMKIDPLKLISSGSMIVVMSPDKSDSYISELDSKGIRATAIGEIKESGIELVTDNGIVKINPPESDEIYKVI
jgi:hydrogenase expression/formation protein HypE